MSASVAERLRRIAECVVLVGDTGSGEAARQDIRALAEEVEALAGEFQRIARVEDEAFRKMLPVPHLTSASELRTWAARLAGEGK